MPYLPRIQSQFDHLSETYFNNFEYDLGERELGYALSFDHDLEMFAASVGLIKTSVATVLKDKGMLDTVDRIFRNKTLDAVVQAINSNEITVTPTDKVLATAQALNKPIEEVAAAK